MRAVVAILTAVFVIGVGAALWVLSRPPAPALSTTSVARPAPVAAPKPDVAPPAAAPTPAAARRSAPKPATPEPAAPAAPVVEAPTTATLRIESDVPGATVFLDRVGVGSTPLTLPNIAPGSHRLNVSATGYDGYAETIDVAPGPRTIAINFKDVKLDVTLNAVHKHGMGSCKGVLHASVQGLRYVAADGKDTVSVAMADFDTFEVDFLAKNLRLKTKSGKTLNFTDPDGNAVRLFEFHRDVEKARKRLAAQ